jgi:hypothetical protein
VTRLGKTLNDLRYDLHGVAGSTNGERAIELNTIGLNTPPLCLPILVL